MPTFKLDGANHSVVSFAVPYVANKFRAGFTGLDATLEVGDDGTPQSLEGSTDTTNLVVRDENLKGHMMSGDFFDAENAPQISFQSSAIERNGDSLKVRGEISLRGATQAVELTGSIKGPLTDQFGQERVGVELHGTVDRTAHGVNWNVDTPGGPALGNDVEVAADLFFVKQQ